MYVNDCFLKPRLSETSKVKPSATMKLKGKTFKSAKLIYKKVGGVCKSRCRVLEIKRSGGCKLATRF